LLRIIFDNPQDLNVRMDLMDQLATMNCDCEGSEHRLAVSVRHNSHLDEGGAYFDSCGFTWECANPPTTSHNEAFGPE